MSRCFSTLRGEGHSSAGWGIGGSVYLQTASPEYVRSGNGRPLIALRCLLLMLASTPLRTAAVRVFPVSGGLRYINVRTFKL